MTSKTKKPSLIVAVGIIVFLVMMLYFTIKTFGVDSLGGGSQISLLITSFLSSTKKIEFSVVNNGNAKVYIVKGVSFNILSFNLKSLILQKI